MLFEQLHEKNFWETSWLTKELYKLVPIDQTKLIGNPINGLEIWSGSCTARLNLGTKQVSASMQVTPLTASDWENLFEVFTEKPLYLSLILAKNFLEEIPAVCSEHKISLLPQKSEIIFILDGKEQSDFSNSHFQAFYSAYVKHLAKNPFDLFELRGLSYEQLIAELKKRRKQKVKLLNNTDTKKIDSISTTDLSLFYKCGQKVKELESKIKADEIPASVLKWLDPLPLPGIEEHVDRQLQEAYEKVARLAQSYGIGI